jgi:hypothetical protein
MVLWNNGESQWLQCKRNFLIVRAPDRRQRRGGADALVVMPSAFRSQADMGRSAVNSCSMAACAWARC